MNVVDISLAKMKLERIVTKNGSIFGFEVLTSNFEELGIDFNTLTPTSRVAINNLLRNQVKSLAKFQCESNSLAFKPGQVLFLNIEPWQVEDHDMCCDIALVHQYLNKNGVNLCLEITEREFDGLRFHIILKNLFYLREKGVQLALDDYSFNEKTWRTLLVKCVNCVDYLKVDLASRPDNDMLIQFISGLVSKPKIIFEKIETENDLRKMQSFEVESPLLQGFLFN